jgi:diadenosine tetraphosphatase ApaH/serine/threonine PP2A family protein phosphatase
MRYAVLSDIHGNLEALRAVLADCQREADEILCLGDVVGYGADPLACVELTADRATAIVAGNHEHGVAGRLPLRWFNPAARAAVEWTAEQLDEDHRAWLGALPLIVEMGEATLVHASPARPDEWDYLVTAEDGFAVFPAFTTRLAFVGHSHQPGFWSLGSSGPTWRAGGADVALENGRRYLLNVGSVGQPRDRDPRACYVVWNPDARLITFRRIAYDIAAARRKILQAGLPRFLADRIQHGV